MLPEAEKAKYEAGLRKLPASGRGGMRVWVQDPGGPARAHPPLSAMPPSAAPTAPPVPSRAPAASASSWPERLTPPTSITAVEVPAEGCVASETPPYPPYAWSRQPSCSSHPSCSSASSDDSEPEPVDTATHAPSATCAAPFGAPTAPLATPTAPTARKDGGGSERGEFHLADPGQVGMTRGQQALYMARQRMQISRTDAEIHQVVHTLALALGATRTEAASRKALLAVLVLLNRPEMSEQEVCTSMGVSSRNFKRWQSRVLNA